MTNIETRERFDPGLRRLFLVGFVIALGLIALFVCMVFVAGESQRAARRIECRTNLKQIALALHHYRNDFDCFPPAYIADDAGKPMHSWRVLILPYMECKEIYRQYNFNEPWDGPTNSRLNSFAPEEYVCPAGMNRPRWETSYCAVVGEEKLWLGEEPFSITDGARNFLDTILVVEVADSGISWLEPKDLNIDHMNIEINDWSRLGIRSHHRGGAHALFGDGTVRFLTRRDQSDLKRYLRVDDGRATNP